MSFPNQKVHRPSRRRAGRGQTPNAASVAMTAVGSGATVVITFAAPVVITGPISLTVATLTYVSQVVNSPTQVTVTMSAAVAGHAYTLPSPQPNVASYQGGQVLGTTGTF